MSRARASLVVLSTSLSGDELGRRLGFEGDQQWKAGDPVRSGASSQQRFGGWTLNSRAERSAGATEHLTDLLSRISNLDVRLEALSAAGEIESSRIWVHLDSPDRGFVMEPEMLRAVAAFGSLEVDIYS
jgi:uncharacterized protein DUF4279